MQWIASGFIGLNNFRITVEIDIDCHIKWLSTKLGYLHSIPDKNITIISLFIKFNYRI